MSLEIKEPELIELNNYSDNGGTKLSEVLISENPIFTNEYCSKLIKEAIKTLVSRIRYSNFRNIKEVTYKKSKNGNYHIRIVFNMGKILRFTALYYKKGQPDSGSLADIEYVDAYQGREAEITSPEELSMITRELNKRVKETV